MDKDRIQQVADRIAQECRGMCFDDLPCGLRHKVYLRAEQEVIEQDAEQADAMREREKYHGV